MNEVKHTVSSQVKLQRRERERKQSVQQQLLTSAQQFPHAQVADDEPHDGGLVQAGADAVGQGQLLGQLVENLRLLPTPAPRCIPGLLLPPVRAHPAGDRRLSDWLGAGHGLLCLSLGAQSSYSATPIILTFMSLGERIHREENENANTEKHTQTQTQ
ncbi:hypothetical protein F7725_008047 [Dissostichus mawsoni]|uniref:Uncharacterized protein n=1 Tax=Dissostichus mawsoni TaxID=36200 RepID=A0A7J5Y624_DISMA|nr:hypothetical protein F7725_008047 [Dissostichus mawsoni]